MLAHQNQIGSGGVYRAYLRQRRECMLAAHVQGKANQKQVYLKSEKWEGELGWLRQIRNRTPGKDPCCLSRYIPLRVCMLQA